MKFRIFSYFAQLTSIVSCFRKYHSKVLKRLVFSKSRKVQKSPFQPPAATENGGKLCIFFSQVKINAVISINVLWIYYSACLGVSKALI